MAKAYDYKFSSCPTENIQYSRHWKINIGELQPYKVLLIELDHLLQISRSQLLDCYLHSCLIKNKCKDINFWFPLLQAFL